MSNILDKRTPKGSTPEELKRHEFVRRQELEDLKAIMTTLEGRRLMWRILGETHLFEISYTGNSETFFREGKRAIGLSLFRDLHLACPELYRKMEAEASEQRKEV